MNKWEANRLLFLRAARLPRCDRWAFSGAGGHARPHFDTTFANGSRTTYPLLYRSWQNVGGFNREYRPAAGQDLFGQLRYRRGYVVREPLAKVVSKCGRACPPAPENAQRSHRGRRAALKNKSRLASHLFIYKKLRHAQTNFRTH